MIQNWNKESGLMLLLRTNTSPKRLLFHLSLFAMASLAWAQQNTATKPWSWSGVLVSSACNADEAFNESPECARNVPGAKLALYDDTNRVIYSLEPQANVSAKLGDAVTVRGKLDGDTIQLASVELMSIGLAAPCSFFFDLPTGDPSVKGSWSSCRVQLHDSKSERSSWRRSAMTRKKS
jgi:hypothetical protein